MAQNTWNFLRTKMLAPWQMLRLSWQAKPFFFVGVLVVEAIQGIIPLSSAWVTKLLFDLLALGLQGQSLLWREMYLLLALQAGLAIFTQSLQPVVSYLNAELNRHLSLKVQMTIFDKVNRLEGLAPFEDPRTQDTLQMGAQGGHLGSSQALGILTGLLRSTITMIGFLGVLVAFNPLLAGLVAVAALPQLFVQFKIGRQRLGLAEDNIPKQRRTGYYSVLLSAAHFVKELRLFNLGSYFLSAFKELTLEINQARRAQQLRELRWQMGLNLLSNMVSSGAFVIVVVQAFQGQLSLGDVTLYTSAVGSVQGALSGIVFGLSRIQENALFFSRYTDLLALAQPIYISPSPRPVPSLHSALKLRHVSFRYSTEHPWVLRDVSLTLPAGSCLALVGLNGAGKSTLVKLLLRLYDPWEGEILWDGVDIRQFDPAELRHRMGAIFQDFVHFDLTAFENVALGDVTKLQDVDHRSVEERVRCAAEKAGVHETVMALPKGYQTMLSRWLAEDKQGVDLSGGEWQKIALARLFIRDADLLILDEPTAALDVQTEYELYRRFVELMNGRTSLLITHRFSTVRMADRIAVLENGAITECGEHDELIARSGSYARWYQMQAERYR